MCRIEIPSFSHSLLIIGFVTRVVGQMPHAGHLGAPNVFSGVRVTRSLVFCVMFRVIGVCPVFLFTIVLSVFLPLPLYYFQAVRFKSIVCLKFPIIVQLLL